MWCICYISVNYFLIHTHRRTDERTHTHTHTHTHYQASLALLVCLITPSIFVSFCPHGASGNSGLGKSGAARGLVYPLHSLYLVHRVWWRDGLVERWSGGSVVTKTDTPVPNQYSNPKNGTISEFLNLRWYRVAGLPGALKEYRVYPVPMQSWMLTSPVLSKNLTRSRYWLSEKSLKVARFVTKLNLLSQGKAKSHKIQQQSC